MNGYSMHLLGLVGQSAAESPLFWTLVGLIGFTVFLFAIRQFVLWYLGITEIKNQLNQILENIDLIKQKDREVVLQKPKASIQSSSASQDSDIDIAVALAALTHFKKI